MIADSPESLAASMGLFELIERSFLNAKAAGHLCFYETQTLYVPFPDDVKVICTIMPKEYTLQNY